MKKPTLKEIKQVMKAAGMTVFSKPFDMTLGGIRTKDNRSEEYNDWLFMMYHDKDGKLCGIMEPGTTDAGLYYREHPLNIDGAAIIMHGHQNKACYEHQNPPVDGKLGHHGKEAFRQIAPMKYVRDPDRDKYLEFDGEIISGIFYTNGHDMGTGKQVGKNSAGCWGSSPVIMDKFYALARLQSKHGFGTKFSYAMLHENMF